MMKQPIRVLVTGAAGQIAYSLIPLIASGAALGEDQPVILHLLDIERAAGALQGVVMELEDGAYPLLKSVVATTNVAEGFAGIEVAVLLGGFPRLDGMTRADLLSKNSAIFKEQGAALGAHANPNCKVVVVANPANTNALIAYTASGGKIPAKNFTCLTRLDQNRAVGQLSKELGVLPGAVTHAVIWGNHSADQFPDSSLALVNIDGKEEKVSEVLAKKNFNVEDFMTKIQTRGAAVIKARGKSSAMSAANAVKDHLHSWLCGTKEGEWASMGVVTDGSYYDIPAGLVFSVPTTCKNGEWEVVQGLTLSEDGKKRVQVNVEKLQNEFEVSKGK